MKQADNAWMYEKYSTDVKMARNLFNCIINETQPRYLKNAPEQLYQVTQRIVDNKIKRTEAYKTDFYFDE